LFESNEVAAPQVLPGGPGIPQPLPSGGGTGHWDQDQVCFLLFFFFFVNKNIFPLHNTLIKIKFDLILLQSYFSEPEFDSEYQHQHIHKSKVNTFIYFILL